MLKNILLKNFTLTVQDLQILSIAKNKILKYQIKVADTNKSKQIPKFQKNCGKIEKKLI
jgi:uncharacterized protein YihD (DUF1040 family)